MDTWILLDNLAWTFRNDLHISFLACMNTTCQQYILPCNEIECCLEFNTRGEREEGTGGEGRGHACTAPTPRFFSGCLGLRSCQQSGLVDGNSHLQVSGCAVTPHELGEALLPVASPACNGTTHGMTPGRGSAAGVGVVASDSAFKPLITRRSEGSCLGVFFFRADAGDDAGRGEHGEGVAAL